jgi:hypothetical protein
MFYALNTLVRKLQKQCGQKFETGTVSDGLDNTMDTDCLYCKNEWCAYVGIRAMLAWQGYGNQDAGEPNTSQLAQALRSVCTELRLERGCDEGACGTDRCFWSGCTAGPAMGLLARCGSEAKTDG